MKKITCVENIGSYRWGPLSDRKLEYMKWSRIPDDVPGQKDIQRSFYDRDTDKVIINFFQSGAGGLFLTNCLSLSPSVCSSLSLSQKKELWNRYLDTQGTFWNDLYLNNYSPEVGRSHAETKNLVHDGYFFIHEHEHQNLQQHFEFWSKPNIIYFKNADLFCKIRKLLKNVDGRFAFKSYESLLPDLKKYPTPKSFSDFSRLSIEKQKEYMKVYARKNQDLPAGAYYKEGKRIYIWDTNWYFSETETSTHIKELYDLFELKGFNENLISSFHKKWITKLDEKSGIIKQIPEGQYIKTMKSLLKDTSSWDIPISNFKDLPK